MPVTLDEMTMLSAAVVRGTSRALIVGDLPFGSYQEGPVQALRSATRLVKDAGGGAVKLEGGERSHEQIKLLVESGIPVMADIGLTPQSVNSMGYRVQGRGEEAAAQLLRDAKAVQDAGAFAVVLELVPAELAAEATRVLHIRMVGIGAGPDTDAQVLVWTDMAGVLTSGRVPKFVKKYAALREVMGDAAKSFAEEVVGGTFPLDEHSCPLATAAPPPGQPADLPQSAGCPDFRRHTPPEARTSPFLPAFGQECRRFHGSLPRVIALSTVFTAKGLPYALAPRRHRGRGLRL